MGSPPTVVVALDPGGGGVESPAPCPLRLPCDLKDWAGGSIQDLCNLTGHVTREFGDSLCSVEKSANCTYRDNRGGEGGP